MAADDDFLTGEARARHLFDQAAKAASEQTLVSKLAAALLLHTLNPPHYHLPPSYLR